MEVQSLYNRLEALLVEYTTHNWKNGWQHEGNRLSKELTIQEEVRYNNLFLLEKQSFQSFSLDGPDGFNIDVKLEHGKIRIYIKSITSDIFYFIDSEMVWLAQQDFIFDLCENIYNANVKIHKYMSNIPNDLFGNINPDFAKSYYRERRLNELGIE